MTKYAVVRFGGTVGSMASAEETYFIPGKGMGVVLGKYLDNDLAKSYAKFLRKRAIQFQNEYCGMTYRVIKVKE